MNYPKGTIINNNSITNDKVSYANRGMNLEHELNISNDYYREKNIALVYKKPTPIKVTKVDYKDKVKIKEGFFENPSTTDYNGIYKGKYIDFEAKETMSTTSFPLHNIHIHQIDHIRRVLIQNGIVFLIVSFTKLNETYLLLGKDFIDYIDNCDRKSIPYNYFKEKGYILEYKYNPRIDYISVIDKIYGGKNGN